MASFRALSSATSEKSLFEIQAEGETARAWTSSVFKRAQATTRPAKNALAV
jgi:hypothetical protein